MSDVVSGRLPAAPAGLQQPLPGDQPDRPVAERETPRETTAAELPGEGPTPCGCGHEWTAHAEGGCGARRCECSRSWREMGRCQQLVAGKPCLRQGVRNSDICAGHLVIYLAVNRGR